jgi:hypothetical protein
LNRFSFVCRCSFTEKIMIACAIMSERKKRGAIAADTCYSALEVVAKRGWLEQPAWSVSQAVHAFAKQLPMLVVLADETPADTVQQLLLRPYIVANAA